METAHITSKATTAIGPNATNIFINLLPINVFCDQRVILSQLLTFFIAISPGQPRAYLKQTIFFEVSKLVQCVKNSVLNMLIPNTLLTTVRKSPTQLTFRLLSERFLPRISETNNSLMCDLQPPLTYGITPSIYILPSGSFQLILNSELRPEVCSSREQSQAFNGMVSFSYPWARGSIV